MDQAASEQRRIVILLSTFNGERFLREQLQSFVSQNYTNWSLYWRDDGSRDGTLGIMNEFQAKVGADRCKVSASSGRHLGAGLSFLTLLSECGDAKMIAFSDQDDIWLPNKLDHAIASLITAGVQPALYCTRQYLVNEKLRDAKLSPFHRGSHGFPESLTQNIVIGNTIVMNSGAIGLVTSMRKPEVPMHDWWCYIVISAFGGRIIYDERPSILYRLHRNNLIGVRRGVLARGAAAMRRGPTGLMTMMWWHTGILIENSARLPQQAFEDTKLIRSALEGGVIKRILALRCRRFRRSTTLENVLFSFWFLIGGRAHLNSSRLRKFTIVLR